METVAVCITTLAGLMLVLRHLERSTFAARVSVNATTEAELRELIKSAEMRLSKLEMGRMTR